MYFCKNLFILLSAMINESIPHCIFRIQIIAVENISKKIFKSKIVSILEPLPPPPKKKNLSYVYDKDEAVLSSYFLNADQPI